MIVLLFHAGTKSNDDNGTVKTNGGRVIALTSFGGTYGRCSKKIVRNSAEKINPLRVNITEKILGLIYDEACSSPSFSMLYHFSESKQLKK